jgi:hypothetical protein
VLLVRADQEIHRSPVHYVPANQVMIAAKEAQKGSLEAAAEQDE